MEGGEHRDGWGQSAKGTADACRYLVTIKGQGRGLRLRKLTGL